MTITGTTAYGITDDWLDGPDDLDLTDCIEDEGDVGVLFAAARTDVTDLQVRSSSRKTSSSSNSMLNCGASRYCQYWHRGGLGPIAPLTQRLRAFFACTDADDVNVRPALAPLR